MLPRATEGMQEVAAVVVVLAVIDPYKSKVMLSSADHPILPKNCTSGVPRSTGENTSV